MRVAALVLSLVAAVACAVSSCPEVVRAASILAFWVWVPGAVVISLVAGRWVLRPSAPALGIGVALLVLEAQIALHLHLALGRGAMAAWASMAAVLLAVSAPERLPRRASDVPA